MIKEITQQDADWLTLDPDCGFYCYMGGVNLDKPKIVVASLNRFYLINSLDDIPDWLGEQIKQEKEIL